MALYKDGTHLTPTTDTNFDTVHHPGAKAPFSGIYRCVGCGHEVVSTEHHPLPPQNHHQHKTNQGTIRWKLLVYAEHAP